MRTDTFGLRVSDEERQLIDLLAATEERTPSDVIRRLIRAAAREIQNTNERAPAAKQGSAFVTTANP